MQINRSIFRQYDVRGLVDKDLTPEFAYALARGYSKYLLDNKPAAKKVSIGHDARISSPVFAKAMKEGFKDSGLNVVMLDMVPTPLLYFSLNTLDVDGGIMITGSHNPPEYNGFKISLGTLSVYGDEIQKIADIIENEDFINAEKKGIDENFNIIPMYEKYILENIKIKNPERIKLVVDSGNGVGGFVAVPIMKKLGLNVISLFEEPDGNFPNHHPDPTIPEYVQDMIKTVKKESATLGIGFDGDADRIGVINKDGNIIWGDKILTIFARSILKEVPGATIIGEVKCSKTFYDDIKAHGGNGIMWKAGHSLIKAKMRETGAMLGGEVSGHIFFKHRFFGHDDAIYAALRLLEILADTDSLSINELLEGIHETVTTPELKYPVPDESKFEIMEKIVEDFKKDGYNVVDVDGARIIFDDGWGLVRPSNTTPVFVLRFEAETEKRLNEIKALVETKIKKFA